MVVEHSTSGILHFTYYEPGHTKSFSGILKSIGIGTQGGNQFNEEVSLSNLTSLCAPVKLMTVCPLPSVF